MAINGRIAHMPGADKPAEPPDGEAVSDYELLDRYVLHQDESAFEALIRRYGSLVLAVCNRVLQDRHAAEDAFQATFLALALQGRSLKQDAPLGSWLYTVAYRTARKLRNAAVRRQANEKQVGHMAVTRPEDEVFRNELRSVVDEELNHLQEKYRTLLVLVYLEGKAHQQVAAELGWPSGSVSRRVARGLELLRGRLARRGIVLSSAVLLSIFSGTASGATLSADLVAATLKTASLALAGVPTAAGAVGGTWKTSLASKVKACRLAVSGKTLVALGLLFSLGGGAALVEKAWSNRAVFMGAASRPVPVAPMAPGMCGGVAGWGARNVLNGEQGRVLAVTFLSPDRPLVAAEAPVKAPPVTLWGPTANQDRALPGKPGPFVTAAFSDSGSLLAAAGEDHAVEVWDVPGSVQRQTLRGHESRVLALAFLGDETLASAGQDGTVRLWDLATGEQLTALEGRIGAISALAVAPDTRLLAAGSRNGMVKIWDFDTHAERAVARAHTDAVAALAFAPDGQTLASGGSDTLVKSWDTRLTPKATFVGHEGPVQCLAFAPDGTALVSGSRDRSVRVWNPKNGEQFFYLPGHAAAVTLALFDRTGSRLATADADQVVKTWTFSSLRPRRFSGRNQVRNSGENGKKAD